MIENLLKNKNLRLTPFRKEVLEVFTSSPNAISIGDIEDNLKQFDRITLYRTIKSFIENNLSPLQRSTALICLSIFNSSVLVSFDISVNLLRSSLLTSRLALAVSTLAVSVGRAIQV